MSPRPWESRSLADLLNVLGRVRSENGRKEDRGFTSTTPAARSATQQTPTLEEAIRRFLDETPILPLIEDRLSGVHLQRIARTNGGEFAGPCPLCGGGTDRLRVWPTPHAGTGRAWCRQCGFSGDALSWATRFAGRNPAIPGSMGATLREHGLLGARTKTQEGPPLSRLSNSANPSDLSDLTPAERESFEERAGIREFDGGFPREIAERLALDDVLRARKEGSRE